MFFRIVKLLFQLIVLIGSCVAFWLIAFFSMFIGGILQLLLIVLAAVMSYILFKSALETIRQFIMQFKENID